MTRTIGLGPSRLRTAMLAAAAVVGAAALFYFLPLFHVVPLEVARQQSASGVFNAAAFVETFWTERLLPSADKAVDAATLLAAVEQDRTATRRTYGRSVGLGGAYYYCVSGTGRVVSLGGGTVGLAVREGAAEAEIHLETGHVFGNAVRDGSGLLNVNDFPNSRDFNEISSEINRRIEQQVLPGLRAKAVLGARVRFTGCAEIVDEDADLRPLRLIPFHAEVLL